MAYLEAAEDEPQGTNVIKEKGKELEGHPSKARKKKKNAQQNGPSKGA